jgi:aryl-alcohol dehydrogenase-like predicted oxidoreductase
VTSQLALGAVQFGMAYGIANEAGQIGAEETRRIVTCARSSGFDTLDTAIAYGDSEQRLGDIGVSEWRVVTKLPPLPNGERDIRRWVLDSIRGSLQRLRVDRLAGLLLHRSADLADSDAILYAALLETKQRGLVEKIGISIYDPSELEVMSRFRLDLVQAPFNVLDRRLTSSGWLSRLQDNGVEVHARSVFLQGLLLMPPKRRPATFDRWSSLWRRWDDWLLTAGYTALDASLGFVLATSGIDRVIVGVDSIAQLRQVVAASNTIVRSVPDDLSTTDLELISPNLWRR